MSKVWCSSCGNYADFTYALKQRLYTCKRCRALSTEAEHEAARHGGHGVGHGWHGGSKIYSIGPTWIEPSWIEPSWRTEGSFSAAGAKTISSRSDDDDDLRYNVQITDNPAAEPEPLESPAIAALPVFGRRRIKL